MNSAVVNIHVTLFEFLFSFLLDIYLRVKFLGLMAIPSDF